MSTLRQVYETFGKILADNPDLEHSDVVVQPRFCSAESDYEIFVSDTKVFNDDEGWGSFLNPDADVPEDAEMLSGNDRVIVIETFNPPDMIPDIEDDDSL